MILYHIGENRVRYHSKCGLLFYQNMIDSCRFDAPAIRLPFQFIFFLLPDHLRFAQSTGDLLLG